MPGPAFHLQLLELTIRSLEAGSASDKAKAQAMRANMGHAQLGALGPDLLRGQAVTPDVLDAFVAVTDWSALDAATAKTLLQKSHPNPEMTLYGLLYRVLQPHLDSLAAIDAYLATMLGIAIAEDANGLKNAKPLTDATKPAFDDLAKLKPDLEWLYRAGRFLTQAGLPVIQSTQPNATKAWRPVELLRWKRTGAMARALTKQARDSGDAALQAYAAGWMTHVAGAVVGEPFVNSIAGGPRRTHWWRHMLARNYVDSWTFGRYVTPATLSGNTPTPDYNGWASLPAGALDAMVNLDAGFAGRDAMAAVLSGTLPATPAFDAVSGLLATAVDRVLGASSGTPITLPPALTDPVELRRAYVGSLSVLWFMTNQSALSSPRPGAPPPGSETPPPWYGSGSPPPAPSPGGGGGSGSSSDATASAVIAAILGVIAVLTGWLPAAVGAIVLAILAADSDPPSFDWTNLRTTLYYTQLTIWNIEDGIRRGLEAAGVGYPPPYRLATSTVDMAGVTQWAPAQDDSKVELTRSRRLESYPLHVYGPVVNGTTLLPDAGFSDSPASTPEEPGTRPLFAYIAYPDAIVDGAAMANGGLRGDSGNFPTSDHDFGGAVDNAADLLRHDGDKLPNFNLDGDRGYGWKTWRAKVGTSPGDITQPVQIAEEP